MVSSCVCQVTGTSCCGDTSPLEQKLFLKRIPHESDSKQSLCSPASVSAPVWRGRPTSVVLRPMTPPLSPPAPVWTPPTILPVSKKFHFMLVTVATVAVALLPLVVVAIPPLWRPPFVCRLIVFELPPVPEAGVRYEGAGALGVTRIESWGWKWRVKRMGRVHGIVWVVIHGWRVHGRRHGWVCYRWRRYRWHHVWLVGVLSRNLGRWRASCGAGKRWGWKVWRGIRESLSGWRLRKWWADRALVQSTRSLRVCWWGVLHEVRVRVHVSAAAMVT